MFSLNPYAIGVGALAALALVVGFKHQDNQIHKYHTLYNCVSKKLDCPKNNTEVTVPDLQAQIALMNLADKTQQKVTTKTVEKVVKAKPEIVEKVKVIHDLPLPPDCKTPEVPEELKELM